MQIEDTYATIAMQRTDDKPAVILCDRGVMDPAAYVDKEVFTKLLNALGVDNVFDVKHYRYDLVIHLVSAALGKEEFYSLDNNVARTESVEEACRVDSRILEAWAGHPHIYCINNRTLFKEKMVRALQVVCKAVGAPDIGKSTVKRKFLVKEVFDDKLAELHVEDSNCEYTYLQDGGDFQQRLKKRETEGIIVYTHVVRNMGESGEYERYTESSRNISAREYDTLSSVALHDHDSVIIKKRSFVYHSQYFSLAIFENIHPGLMLLELYEEPDVNIDLPRDYMMIEGEVTSESRFSMFHLSKKDCPPIQ